jgi:membrane-associated phospholipid phosphatase
MTDDIQRQELSKTSPIKKASYVAVASTAAAIVMPFAFGINTFSWIGNYLVQNWPQLIIIAGFAIWMGKSRM